MIIDKKTIEQNVEVLLPSSDLLYYNREENILKTMNKALTSTGIYNVVYTNWFGNYK